MRMLHPDRADPAQGEVEQRCRGSPTLPRPANRQRLGPETTAPLQRELLLAARMAQEVLVVGTDRAGRTKHCGCGSLGPNPRVVGGMGQFHRETVPGAPASAGSGPTASARLV